MAELLQNHLLGFLTFTPLVFGLILLFLPTANTSTLKLWTLLGTIVSLSLSLILWRHFDPTSADYQFSEIRAWFPSLGVSYHLAVDGISLPLVMLTTVISPIALLGTWSSVPNTVPKARMYLMLVLTLETAVIGSFLSLDLFLFYIFWEAVLIPMYFLIGIWGGKERIYATVKFFLYTLFGSLLMLIAIFWLIMYHHETAGFLSASLLDLSKLTIPFDHDAALFGLLSPQGLVFAAFALAFAIKVPMFPFHTWLPDAHVQAPTIGSVFLAAVLLKMGTYGFMRFALPLMPDAAYAFTPFFLALGVIGIIYGAMVALVQDDVKKLVAYSSVSHMGYILLGLFSFNALGLGGALYQMINHGIATGGLFLIVGFLYERRHTRLLKDFGGLARVTPLLAVFFMIILLSSAALPGTNGFVGEFPILLGVFQRTPLIAALAGLGVIFGAVYLLRTYQQTMLGPVTNSENQNLSDLNGKELTAMLCLTFFVFGIGFFPQSFFGRSNPTIERLALTLQERTHRVAQPYTPPLFVATEANQDRALENIQAQKIAPPEKIQNGSRKEASESQRALPARKKSGRYADDDAPVDPSTLKMKMNSPKSARDGDQE